MKMDDQKEARRPFLNGQRIYLRLIEEADVNEEYIRWLNDSEVTHYMETGRFPSTQESIRKYLDRFHNDGIANVIFAIVDRGTNQHIGNVTLNRINWIHRTADTGLMLGRKDCWGKGYAHEAWSLLLDYAFHRLGLRKIIAGAIGNHVTSLAVLGKLGFRMEGTLRQEVFVDGAYRDVIRMGLFREEFQRQH